MKSTNIVLALVQFATLTICTTSGQVPEPPKAPVDVKQTNPDLEWFNSINDLLGRIGAKGVLDPDPANPADSKELHDIRQSVANVLANTWDAGKLIFDGNYSIRSASWPTIDSQQNKASDATADPNLSELKGILENSMYIDKLQLGSMVRARHYLEMIYKSLTLAPPSNPQPFQSEFDIASFKVETPVRAMIGRWIALESFVFQKLGTTDPASKTTLAYAIELEKLLDEMAKGRSELVSYTSTDGEQAFFSCLKRTNSNLASRLKERDAFPAEVQEWWVQANKAYDSVSESMTILWNPTTKPEVSTKLYDLFPAQRKQLETSIHSAERLLARIQIQHQAEQQLIKQLHGLVTRNRKAWFDELRAQVSTFARAQLNKYDIKFRIIERSLSPFVDSTANRDSGVVSVSPAEAHLASILSMTNRIDVRLNSTTGVFHPATNRIEPKLLTMDELNRFCTEAQSNKTLDPAQPSLIVLRGFRFTMRGDFVFVPPAKHVVIVCDSLEVDNVRLFIPNGWTVTVLCHRLVDSNKYWTHISCSGAARFFLYTSSLSSKSPIQMSGDSKQFMIETDGEGRKPWESLQKSSQSLVSEFVTNYWADLTEQMISWYLESASPTSQLANLAAEVLSLPRTVSLPNNNSRRVDELKKQAATRVYKDSVVHFYVPDEKLTVSALVRYQDGSLIAEVLPNMLQVERTPTNKLGTLALLEPNGVSLEMLIRPSISDHVQKIAKRIMEERIPGVLVVEADWRTMGLRWVPNSVSIPGIDMKPDRLIAWDRSRQYTKYEFRLADTNGTIQFLDMLQKKMLFHCEVFDPDLRKTYGVLRMPVQMDDYPTDFKQPVLSDFFGMGEHSSNHVYSVALLNVDQVRFGGVDGELGTGSLVDLHASTIQARYVDSANRSLPATHRSLAQLSGTFALELPILKGFTVELDIELISTNGKWSFSKTITLPSQKPNGVSSDRVEMTKSEMEHWLATPEKLAVAP